jgi:hypothetical protein
LSNHSFLPFIEAVEKVEESPEILVYPQYIPKNTVNNNVFNVAVLYQKNKVTQQSVC